MNQDVMLPHHFRVMFSISFSKSYFIILIVIKLSKILTTVKINLVAIFREFWYCVSSSRILWNVNWLEKNSLHWFIFWSHQYKLGCTKWFLIIWWITQQNGAKRTVYLPTDELYWQEGWNELFHCVWLHNFLNKIEIENTTWRVVKKTPPIESVNDKMSMFIYVLKNPIHQGKYIIQNIQHWKWSLLHWMTYFRMISRIILLKMLYVRILLQLIHK